MKYYDTLADYMGACHPGTHISLVIAEAWERGGQTAVEGVIEGEKAKQGENPCRSLASLDEDPGGRQGSYTAIEWAWKITRTAGEYVGVEFDRSLRDLSLKRQGFDRDQDGWFRLRREKLPAGKFLVASASEVYEVVTGSRGNYHMSGVFVTDDQVLSYDWWRPLPAVPGRGHKTKPQSGQTLKTGTDGAPKWTWGGQPTDL